MANNNAGKLRNLYSQAIQLPPEQREEFLQHYCGGDPRLRDQLSKLLEHAAPIRDVLSQAMVDAHRVRQQVNERELQQAVEETWRTAACEALSLPIIENFILKEVLGEGGMGIVYRAQQHDPLPRQVAVKVMKPGLDSIQFLRRFRIEQTALALMKHPSIAAVLEAGLTHSGHPFFAMELIDGQPIDAFCRDHECDWRERVQLIVDTCRAIQHAHKKGIIHRDLKPSNVMVTMVDDKPAIRVIDFGIAKALSAETLSETQFSLIAHFVGTPHYVSPEQLAFNSAQLGPRTDIYSLGVLLFKLLSNTTPLENHPAYQAALDQQRNLALDELRSFLSDLPARLASQQQTAWRLPRGVDWVLQKCLAFELDDRYETANALAVDLERLLAGEQTVAHPPSAIYRTRKWLIKKRQLSAALALLVFGGILGLLLGLASRWNPTPAGMAERNAMRTEAPASEIPALQEENSQAADLLEAAMLTQMLASIERGRFDRLRRYAFPTSPADELFTSSSREPRYKSPQDGFRRFLRGLAHPEPLRTIKHPDTVWRIAVSPDRERLATACADRWIRVWDVKTGTEIKRYGPLSWEATAVAYSPTEPLLAAGDRDGHVTIWNTNSDEQIARTGDSDGGVESLAWSPDGGKLAAGIRYQFILLISPSGQELTKLSQPGPNPPRLETIQFSSDSKTLYAANAVGGINSWDLESYQVKNEFYKTNPAMMHAFVALDETEQRWLVGAPGRDHLEVISTIDSAPKLANVKLNGYPVSMAQSPDGKHVAVASRNGGLMLCRSANNDWSQIKAETWALEKDSENVTDVVWLSNESLITASSDGNLKHWTIDRLRALHRYHTPASHVYFISPEILGLINKTEATTDLRALMNLQLYRVSDIVASNRFRQPFATVTGMMEDCQFFFEQTQPNHGASKYFSLVNTESIDFYQTSSGRLVNSLRLDTLAERQPDLDFSNMEVKSVSWSADASHCAFLLGNKGEFTRQNAENHLYLVQLETGEPEVTSAVRKHWKLQKCVREIKFVGESNDVAVCVQNGSDKKELRIYPEAHDDFEVVWTSEQWVGFSFSQDARYVAVGAGNNQLLDRKTGEVIPFEAPASNIMSYFMDGSRLLVSVGIESLSVFHVPTRQNLGYFHFRRLPLSERKGLTAVNLGGSLLPLNFNLQNHAGLTTIGDLPSYP